MELRRSIRAQKQNQDRISDLPEPIISDILSYLPTKNAVATSVLSKSWRHRWTAVTSFHVDNGLFPKRRLLSEMLEKMNFFKFLRMVMQNQAADTPNEFRFCCEYPGRDRRLRHGLYEKMVPGNILATGHLKVLKLEGPILLRFCNGSFHKLVVLELSLIRYFQESETLSMVISACPVLQSLTVRRNTKADQLDVCTISHPTLKHLEICFNFNPDHPFWQHGMRESYIHERQLEEGKLEINAPSLEYLKLNDTMSDIISIQGLTSVREVDLDISASAGAVDDMVVELVQSLDHAKIMKVGKSVLEALRIGNSKFSRNLERLTKLIVAYDPSLHWNSLVDLIGRCVNLEVIEVAIDKSKKSKTRSHSKGTSRRNLVSVPSCLSSSLKQVTIKGFDNEKGLISMLKFILDHGLKLERVDLCFDDGEKKYYGLLKKVLMMSRASPTCQIQVINLS